MQTTWLPAPVCVLFRRIVNVVSTLSISHQYLVQKREASDPKSNWSTLKALTWLPWAKGASQARFALAIDGEIPTSEPGTRQTPQPRPSPTTNRPLDVIHRLMQSPALYDPIRVPRNPVALCHGASYFLRVEFEAKFCAQGCTVSTSAGPSSSPCYASTIGQMFSASSGKRLGQRSLSQASPPQAPSRRGRRHSMVCSRNVRGANLSISWHIVWADWTADTLYRTLSRQSILQCRSQPLPRPIGAVRSWTGALYVRIPALLEPC